MARILLLLSALCVVATIVGAEVMDDPFLVKGSVYCDTCLCGYETSASKYLAGAVVKVECKNRTTSELTYTKEGVTDSSGQYQILVPDDHDDDLCDVVLVKSPDPECSTPSEGRDRDDVVLTRRNGINSNVRFANAMGFAKDTPLASCQQILMQYQGADD